MNYKDTLNLPRTDFPMQAKLRELEPEMLNRWAKLDIYGLIRKKSKGLPKFILHDGPPYANGDIHIGHAFNKILKDFVVKYKIMRGFDVPFVPGWDCHGLPVEHQLFKTLGITKHQIGKVEFRKKARDFALRFVDIQREQFKKLGLIADWQRPYLTLDFAYEAEIIRAFAKLAKAKYIYRGLKPINWCIGCETALAEAEVEYEDRRSPSIYVKFPLLNPKEIIKSWVRNTEYEIRNTVSFLIWTTTPWTLMSNVAIAVHPKFKYSLIETSAPEGQKEIMILAEELVEKVMHQIGIKNYRKIGEVKGRTLENIEARHPFLERQSRLVLADYISNQEGTGCVHTAPGHGQEDYLTGLKYKLPVIMPVDEKGRFDKTCGEFSGLKIFEANGLIIDKMRKNKTLLYASEMLHSYPHCWRCKTALITRSTKQWFINVEHKQLRERALKQVRKVRWIPEGSENRILSMLATRPDWCLSRQRFWGVPIPVFYCKGCGKELLQADIMERVAVIVLEEGTDAWFSKSVDELLGGKVHCAFCKEEEFVKEEDIIDVWFDSGVSHQAVLAKSKELGFPASLYLEGSDQHRGWFQTALLTSVPLAGKAPYLNVVTHGFVMDGEGRKMSKSRGNVITPEEITEKFGAEILRLWVASCYYGEDVRISPRILSGVSDAYRKVRNTLRFLIGNLYDFTPDKKVKYNQLKELDKWALSSLTELVRDVSDDFEHFRYYKIFRRLHNFCVQQMSSFYLDVLKDRLYTFDKNSLPRRSAQTAICEIVSSLTKMLAPILTFTAEEIWGRLSKVLGEEQIQSIMLHRWPHIERKWVNPAVDEKMKRLAKLREAVLKAIENEREKGLIHSALEVRVLLFVRTDELFQFLKANLKLLTSIFIVSDVSLKRLDVASAKSASDASGDIVNLEIKIEKIDYPKCQRCWNYRPSVGENNKYLSLCQRCVEVIEKGDE